MTEPVYEIRAGNEPNEDGIYVASVYRDGRYVSTKASSDREKAIAQARNFAEWHRDHDASEEVIAL